ncbi:N-acetyltransferase [uncultured Martelella sp.]|uniref:GNAT family N-acetyltransferase n=1 Tax=uncultured Martelella sp. TaxID=392331 RepID=UPI0029C6B0BD|nr:N-acetyltransferase [uncultured Martelella sp.]
MVTSFTIRNAAREDVPDMVRLINIAGHRLPLWCWGQLEGGAEDPWQAGRESAAREDSAISWTRGTVATLGSDVAALMIAYPLADTAPGYGCEIDHPVMSPLRDLKRQAEGTFHIHVLAAYAEYRGRGLGSFLLDKADRLSETNDISLIVSEANAPARRFYERLGFVERARQALVTAPDWQADGDNWLLMIKPAA